MTIDARVNALVGHLRGGNSVRLNRRSVARAARALGISVDELRAVIDAAISRGLVTVGRRCALVLRPGAMGDAEALGLAGVFDGPAEVE